MRDQKEEICFSLKKHCSSEQKKVDKVSLSNNKEWGDLFQGFAVFTYKIN